MLKNILVPLDGSVVAEAALPYAKAVAGRSGAGLTLVRAAFANTIFPGAAVDQQAAISQAEDYLRSIATRLTTEGFRVDVGIPYGGSPADWIVEESTIR